MKEEALNPAEFVECMAKLVDLPLQAEHQPGVVENFARIMVVAELVMEFPLPAEVEAATIFRP